MPYNLTARLSLRGERTTLIDVALDGEPCGALTVESHAAPALAGLLAAAVDLRETVDESISDLQTMLNVTDDPLLTQMLEHLAGQLATVLELSKGASYWAK